jgi:hypothetical protein
MILLVMTSRSLEVKAKDPTPLTAPTTIPIIFGVLLGDRPDASASDLGLD